MAGIKDWAAQTPDKSAVIEPTTGRVRTYEQLSAKIDRAAAWLIGSGIQAGATIALLLDNRIEMLELCFAGERAGVYFCAVSTHLTPQEIEYILQDSTSELLIVSPATLPLVRESVKAGKLPGVRCMIVGAHGEVPEGFECLDTALAATAVGGPLPERPCGRDLLYSSGTTGRPKGIRRDLKGADQRGILDPSVVLYNQLFRFSPEMVYLSPGPLYHAAPLRFCLNVLQVGGTCVIMSKFDPQQAIDFIERYRITHSQWVPTMFVRMLKLPDDVRLGRDLSSHQMAIHAAAPCPVEIKRAMIEWWGPILYEYYAGSEGIGMTVIGPEDWLAHPGSVGRIAVGELHICDEQNNDLPTGQVGGIYFAGMPAFSYLNDPQKTASAYNSKGWATLGDVGYVDEQGYLYLSDRRVDLIITGGVNVYPQEIEGVLMGHPAVEDAAVIGVPHPDLGAVPKAVIRLSDPTQQTELMAQQLIAYCAERLGRIKLPRTVLFVQDLPRLASGKLLRRNLKDQYRDHPDAGFAVHLKGSERAQ